MQKENAYLIAVLRASPEEDAERMLTFREHFLQGKPLRQVQDVPREPTGISQRLRQKLNEIRWKMFRVPAEVSKKKLLKLSRERLSQFPDLLAAREHLLRVSELYARWDQLQAAATPQHQPFLEWSQEWLALPAGEASLVISNFLYGEQAQPEQIAAFQYSARWFLRQIDPAWEQPRELLKPLLAFHYWRSVRLMNSTANPVVPVNEQKIPSWVYIVFFAILFKVLQLFLTSR